MSVVEESISEIQVLELRAKVAAELARRTGRPWACERSQCMAEDGHVAGPLGERILLRPAGGRSTGRVTVYGCLPPYPDLPRSELPPIPTITIAFHRGFAALMRELDHRFLPQFTAAVTAAARYAQEQQEKAAMRFDLVERIERALGVMHTGTPCKDRILTEHGTEATVEADHIHTRFKVLTSGEVTIQMRWLTAEQAVRVAELLPALYALCPARMAA